MVPLRLNKRHGKKEFLQKKLWGNNFKKALKTMIKALS